MAVSSCLGLLWLLVEVQVVNGQEIPLDSEKDLFTKLFENYRKEFRPVKNGNAPLVVDMYAHLIKIIE